MNCFGTSLPLSQFIFFKVFHGQPIQGWTTTMVVLAFLSGVQLLSLGVLGEYLWRTLDAARGRRGFLVRERTGAERQASGNPPSAKPAGGSPPGPS